MGTCEWDPPRPARINRERARLRPNHGKCQASARDPRASSRTPWRRPSVPRTTFGLSCVLTPIRCHSRSKRSQARPSASWLVSGLPLHRAASGKPERLEFLRERLGLGGVELSGLRYQLLHRAASALVQADRFGARIATLLVHSFGEHSDDKSLADYRRFADAMACAPAFNAVVPVGRSTRRPLLIGWVADAPAAAAVVTQAGSPTELLQRLTRDQAIMGGRPCIRGMRVSVGTVIGLLAAGHTHEEILQDHAYLETEDIQAALTYAAACIEKVEAPPLP